MHGKKMRHIRPAFVCINLPERHWERNACPKRKQLFKVPVIIDDRTVRYLRTGHAYIETAAKVVERYRKSSNFKDGD